MMTTYANRISELVNAGNYPEYGVIMPPKAPGAEDYVSDVNWFDPTALLKARLILKEPSNCSAITAAPYIP